MLVLTRKAGEGIVIGDDITIKVIEMKGGGVRIGIDAPKNRKIYRQEVYDRIIQENREAVQWNMVDLDSLSSNLSTRKKEE
ncbi:MAG TPA: carbon storage regulator CsrA [Desulfobacterales bacterium]|nr:carbon storage regulator CsrA [Desulfobacterales bacterium]HIP39389.1 carbon storage regulator [Desulfocapsa sulfexigens]